MTAFSTADDLVINRKIDGDFTTSTATEEIENVYEISRCAKWIISNGYEKVQWNFRTLIIVIFFDVNFNECTKLSWLKNNNIKT